MSDEEIKTDKISEEKFNPESLKETKEESSGGFFHMQTKTKWVAGISTIMLFLTSILIYATVEGGFGAEMWQVAVWGLCGLVALYSIFKKSLAALLFNLLLFFGVSLLPVWILAYKTFRPAIENLIK